MNLQGCYHCGRRIWHTARGCRRYCHPISLETWNRHTWYALLDPCRSCEAVSLIIRPFFFTLPNQSMHPDTQDTLSLMSSGAGNVRRDASTLARPDPLVFMPACTLPQSLPHHHVASYYSAALVEQVRLPLKIRGYCRIFFVIAISTMQDRERLATCGFYTRDARERKEWKRKREKKKKKEFRCTQINETNHDLQ